MKQEITIGIKHRDDTENKMLWAGKAADLLEETWREKKGRKTPKMGLRTL